jgi:hypothetical protein
VRGRISFWSNNCEQLGRKAPLRGVVVVCSRIKLERRGKIKRAFFESFEGHAQLLLYGKLHVALWSEACNASIPSCAKRAHLVKGEQGLMIAASDERIDIFSRRI